MRAREAKHAKIEEALCDWFRQMQGISTSDVSVIHPPSAQILSRAAGTAGAAASFRDQQQKTANA
jgi:hypothetical protein